MSRVLNYKGKIIGVELEEKEINGEIVKFISNREFEY